MSTFNKNRKCAMCDTEGIQGQMTLLGMKRQKLLQPWYPELKSPDIWLRHHFTVVQRSLPLIHQSCLAQLGLYPFPKGKVELEVIIGQKLKSRITEIVNEHPEARGPRTLIDIVYNQMKKEFNVPTAAGHNQLRYLVAHWVTTRCADSNRGNVACRDDPSTTRLTTADMVRDVDTSCRLSEWMVPTEGSGSSSSSSLGTRLPDLPRGVTDLFQMPEDKARTMVSLVHEMQKNELQMHVERSKADTDDALRRIKAEADAKAEQTKLEADKASF